MCTLPTLHLLALTILKTMPLYLLSHQLYYQISPKSNHNYVLQCVRKKFNRNREEFTRNPLCEQLSSPISSLMGRSAQTFRKLYFCGILLLCRVSVKWADRSSPIKNFENSVSPSFPSPNPQYQQSYHVSLKLAKIMSHNVSQKNLIESPLHTISIMIAHFRAQS